MSKIICGTVQANKEPTPNPPDRGGEIETIRQEIKRIEEQIERNKPKVPMITKTLQAGTVPPDFEVKKTTRKDKQTKKNRGVEPKGKNGTVWKMKREMNDMFKRGKLERGTVPPTTATAERS